MGILTEVLAKNWWQLKQEKVCGAVGCYVQFYSGLLPTPNTALISVNEKEKMLKEVSIMISFNHPNVMSLIGLCFDGETPLLIMPFMMKGSVLEYVKKNRDTLYFMGNVEVEEVGPTLLHYTL